MQCPCDLESDYFALTDDIKIAWSDHKHIDTSQKRLTDRGERIVIQNFHAYLPKIKPLMTGPRRLSRSIRYSSLKAGYERYITSRNSSERRKFMCYFGNAQGPIPEENIIRPDYDWERDIMGYFVDRISHPNEKRARIAEYLSQFGDDADARIISTSNADSGIKTHASLIIPIEDFFAHTAKFQYNFNVSGYRMSIPNRFIESFIVGTRIITDKLKVKWYLPFEECEVFETVEMGYLRNDKIDWAGFDRDIKSLPDTDPQKIIECFNRKWRPSITAKYIIDTLLPASIGE